MKVYRPIKNSYKSQGFGENKAMAKLDSNGRAIQPYIIKAIPNTGVPAGWTNFYNTMGMKGHNGEDWYAYDGMPLYFPVDYDGGWWSKNASDLDGGLGVDVISKNQIVIDGEKTYVKFRFWHLKEGYAMNDVKLGYLIGLCDNTGASSGSHLHWAMKPCDKEGNSTMKNNGYYGGVDFSPYYEDHFVLDVLELKQKALTTIELARKVILDVKIFIKWLAEKKK